MLNKRNYTVNGANKTVNIVDNAVIRIMEAELSLKEVRFT